MSPPRFDAELIDRFFRNGGPVNKNFHASAKKKSFFMQKVLAENPLQAYSLGMENYKGFRFEYEAGLVTFYRPDMEDGAGEWSGFASTLKDAFAMIDEMTFDDN